MIFFLQIGLQHRPYQWVTYFSTRVWFNVSDERRLVMTVDEYSFFIHSVQCVALLRYWFVLTILICSLSGKTVVAVAATTAWSHYRWLQWCSVGTYFYLLGIRNGISPNKLVNMHCIRLNNILMENQNNKPVNRELQLDASNVSGSVWHLHCHTVSAVTQKWRPDAANIEWWCREVIWLLQAWTTCSAISNIH